MSQPEQSNHESPKIKFMRNALDKHPSTVDFTLPNNRIVKIRKIDPSYLNVTDEQKDKIFENHREGSPIFILKKRVLVAPIEDVNNSQSKSKITIRRVVKNVFGNKNEENNIGSTIIKKLVVGDVINVFEDTRDEQANTVVKSFVFIPTSEIINDNDFKSRNIQFENNTEGKNKSTNLLNDSLSGNEIKSDIQLTGEKYDDIKPSGPSDVDDNEISNEDKKLGIIEDIEEIIEEEEEEAEPNNEPSLQNRDFQLMEEEEEVESIENMTEEEPQYFNLEDNTPQLQNMNDQIAEFIQNDEKSANFEEQSPQFANYEGENQQFFNPDDQAPQFVNYDEQLQQYGDYGEQPQQYANNDEQYQQFGNFEEQAAQNASNENENMQFFNENYQVPQFGDNDNIQQSNYVDEQIPNMIIDGEMPQFANIGDEVANQIDMGDDMQSLGGDKFPFLNMGEEEEA